MDNSHRRFFSVKYGSPDKFEKLEDGQKNVREKAKTSGEKSQDLFC